MQAAAPLQGHVHGIVHQIALARLVLPLIRPVIIYLLPLKTAPAVMVAALAGGIRHIGKLAAVRFFLIEDVFFFLRVCHHS